MPSAAPPSTTKPAGGGTGCLVAVIGLPLVILVGLVVGTVLNRPDDQPEERSATIAQGTIDGTRWRVDAYHDVDDQLCAFLYQDDEQLTGGCSTEPDDATFGNRTVVFGKAPDDARQVTVELDDGRRVDIDTTPADGVAGRYYAQVVDGDVDAEGLG